MAQQQTLGGIFEKYAQAKISAKTLLEMIKDTFHHDSEWAKLDDEITRLKKLRKSAEIRIAQACNKDLEKLLEQQTEKKSALQVMTDLAVSRLMRGEALEAIEYDGDQYQPEVKIAFKKIKAERKKRPGGRPKIRPDFYDTSNR